MVCRDFIKIYFHMSWKYSQNNLTNFQKNLRIRWNILFWSVITPFSFDRLQNTGVINTVYSIRYTVCSENKATFHTAKQARLFFFKRLLVCPRQVLGHRCWNPLDVNLPRTNAWNGFGLQANGDRSTRLKAIFSISVGNLLQKVPLWSMPFDNRFLGHRRSYDVDHRWPHSRSGHLHCRWGLN